MSHLQALTLKAKVQEQINITESSFLHFSEDLFTLYCAQESPNHRLTLKNDFGIIQNQTNPHAKEALVQVLQGYAPFVPVLNVKKKITEE